MLFFELDNFNFSSYLMKTIFFSLMKTIERLVFKFVCPMLAVLFFQQHYIDDYLSLHKFFGFNE